MKKLILSSILLLTTLSAFATSNPDLSQHNVPRSYWNPITIYNHTNLDCHYYFEPPNSGFANNSHYKLAKGSSDVYHSGRNDENVMFGTYACAQLRKDGSCAFLVGGYPIHHYNAELIKDIHIDSLTYPFEVRVICLDGGSESCIVK